MASVYERTDIYDLFDDENKYQAIKKHWEKVLEGKDIHSLLDVSIGTGSLTLPLAELGVSLYGSDLSEEMLKKCSVNTEKRGYAVMFRNHDLRNDTEKKEVSVDLRNSDFRKLKENFQEKFDCVASTGNSLPHVTNEELEGVLEQMDMLVKDGGYLYYDMRNWDKILRERYRFYLYDPMFVEDTRVNLIQVWDYNPDDSMTFHLLYTFEKENHIFQKEKFEEHYYPVSRERLIGKLKSMGYGEIQLMCHPAYFDKVDAAEADWYCVIARK